MKPLVRVFRFMLAAQRRPMLYGWGLSLVVLVMGAALLGLSGWFITAAAAAGLAGVGASFDVFRPSAMVRFLALGRTAARYGERLSTHDATLRTLANLRVRLLARFSATDWSETIRLRGASTLNRLIADVDALDGIPLRLMLPIGAGVAAQLLAFVVLSWLVHPAVAWAILIPYLLGTALVFLLAARRAGGPSAAAETAAQDVRARFIDLLRARTDLVMHGQIPTETAALTERDSTRRALQARLDRIGRDAGAALSLVATVAGAATLLVGLRLAEAGAITPAQAALGFFTALGLAETIAPMARAITEVGRMMLAAARMAEALEPPAPDPDTPPPVPVRGAPVLSVTDLALTRPGAAAPVFAGLDLTLAPGEVVALTGPSGVGKSTLLEIAAGLTAPSAGQGEILGQPLDAWSEPALRDVVTLVPQRASLISGTVRENLRIAAPAAEDGALAAALVTVQLAEALAPRGGLDAHLGPHGAGLSGGQARRLVLARALLRAPRLLLLDEPTEGLDRATAGAVLAQLRKALPNTAILLAAHRAAEIEWADRARAMT